uniref:Uncharacterized protein n=1 Tax=Rhizophora mucronata TaxID=61149 RepID=A0A2P2PBW1_RHIMU
MGNFLRPTGGSHLKTSLTESLTPSPLISLFGVLLRFFSLFSMDPNTPNPLLLVCAFDDDCFWILRAASRSRAAVLAGMWRKMALGLLQGLLAGDWNSKRGDFLGSGELVKERMQAFLRKF